MKRKSRPNPLPPARGPVQRALLWLVSAACTVTLVFLLRLARSIYAEVNAAETAAAADSTRLLTGLFVTMCAAGFVAAGLWAALKRALGRDVTDDKG